MAPLTTDRQDSQELMKVHKKITEKKKNTQTFCLNK